MKSENVVTIPQKLKNLLASPKQFKIAHGGRGGAKSYGFGLYCLIRGQREKLNILCCREFQTNISASSHAILEYWINKIPALSAHYKVQEKNIIGANGTEFLFRGLKKEGIGGIKSLNDINICWADEAQYICKKSWDILIPTVIRNTGFEFLISFNREMEDDPVWVEFCTGKRASNTEICHINYMDNPFISEGFIQEAEEMKSEDFDLFSHVYLGEPISHTKAQIFSGKWQIDEFETPADAKFMYGADWGFSRDPTAAVRCYVKDDCLYIDQEVGGVGIDIDATPALFDELEGARKAVCYADSARPETISYMRRNGYPGICPAKKWAGSVEDGIAHIRSYKPVIIHPRCRNTANEFRLYSYKTNKLTGDILNLVEDKHNHYIDAVRYALSEKIKPRAKAKYSQDLNDIL